MPITPTNANNYEVLNDLSKLNAMLAAKGMSLPPNWQTMSPQDKSAFLSNIMSDADQTGQVANKVHEFAEQQKNNMSDLQNSGVALQNPPSGVVAKKVVFNLKRAQMETPQAMPQGMLPVGQPQQAQPSPMDPNAQSQNTGCPEQFTDAGQLQKCLESFASANEAIEFIGDKYTNANQNVSDPNNPQRTDEAFAVIKDSLNDFFTSQDPSLKMKAASTIFDMILPDSAKPQQDQSQVPTQLEQNVQPATLSMVRETNEIIKRLAQQAAKAPKKASFNLKKEAQHQSVHNVMYFGPESTRVDSYTGQLINDWHLVERNKGFGLKIDNVLNIDFEAIWRGSVMDKYSQPYKDKDGNYVGGYLEGRFETDRADATLNNYQLKPGELRKPVMPEYGNIGSRLEANRDKFKERGYEPAGKKEVFNWKKAQADKKKVTAQLEAPRNEEMQMPGDAPIKNMSPSPLCNVCGGYIAKLGPGKTPGVCKNCDQRVTNPTYVQPNQVAPAQQPQMIQMSQVRDDGIYYDGKKFIVYANQQRNVFDEFEQADEHFRNQPDEVDQLPDEQHPVKSKLQPHQREIFDAADRLHIDG